MNINIGSQQTSARISRDSIVLRTPVRKDGAAIRQLIARCPPLDLNSTYAYLLLCAHHSPTCVLAEHDGRPVGFISAYLVPSHEERVFVWQVAVAPEVRGSGVGSRMLEELLARGVTRNCGVLQTTVSPSNQASLKLFQALARRRGAVVTESVAFTREEFGSEDHEEESLLSIPLGHGVSNH